MAIKSIESSDDDDHEMTLEEAIKERDDRAEDCRNARAYVEVTREAYHAAERLLMDAERDFEKADNERREIAEKGKQKSNGNAQFQFQTR